MTKFKTTIHCGNVSTFLEEEWEDKNAAIDSYNEKIFGKKAGKSFRFGDILVQIDKISYVVVEEVVIKAVENPDEVTIDA